MKTKTLEQIKEVVKTNETIETETMNIFSDDDAINDLIIGTLIPASDNLVNAGTGYATQSNELAKSITELSLAVYKSALHASEVAFTMSDDKIILSPVSEDTKLILLDRNELITSHAKHIGSIIFNDTFHNIISATRSEDQTITEWQKENTDLTKKYKAQVVRTMTANIKTPDHNWSLKSVMGTGSDSKIWTGEQVLVLNEKKSRPTSGETTPEAAPEAAPELNIVDSILALIQKLNDSDTATTADTLKIVEALKQLPRTKKVARVLMDNEQKAAIDNDKTPAKTDKEYRANANEIASDKLELETYRLITGSSKAGLKIQERVLTKVVNS